MKNYISMRYCHVGFGVGLAMLQTLAVTSGCFSKPPEAGSAGDDCPAGKQAIEPNFVFASYRNGAVGKLNGDGLDDFAVHGTAGSPAIPYVWVYMGDPAGFDLRCPDEQYPMGEIKSIGAMTIEKLFTSPSPTSDLVIVGKKSDSDAQLTWRHYTGADSVVTSISHNVPDTGVPNWSDAVTSPGFVTGLLLNQNTESETQIFWGGGVHAFATRFSLLNGRLSILMNSANVHPDSTMSLFGMFSFDTGAVRFLFGMSTSDTVRTVGSDDRRKKQPNDRVVFTGDDKSSIGLKKQTDFVRPVSLGYPAAIFATTNLDSAFATLEVGGPGPINSFQIQAPVQSNNVAFRDAFVTNFDETVDGDIRNQMKLLVLQQPRYNAQLSQTVLILDQVDIGSRPANLTAANFLPVPVTTGSINDTAPPFMVVGNFEDATPGQLSVRIFHSTGVTDSPTGTGVNCYLAKLTQGTSNDSLAASSLKCN